jgi:CRP-like cAMP-binding protein
MKSMPSTPEVANKIAISLGRSAIFLGMDKNLLADIASKAQLVQADPGEFLTHEGEIPDSFYVFLNGNAAVLIRHKEKKEDVEMAQLGPGDSAGEIALLLSQPYAASVKATSKVVAARYDAKFFEKMVEEIPEFGLVLARGMGRRLQQFVHMIPVPEHHQEKGSPSNFCQLNL